MKVQVEGSKCQAYGFCVEHAPGSFELDDWGYASATGDGLVATAEEGAVAKAIADCPARAIREVPPESR